MMWMVILVVASSHTLGSQSHPGTPIQTVVHDSSYFLDYIRRYLLRSSLQLVVSESLLEGKRKIARNVSSKTLHLSRMEALDEPNVEFHNYSTAVRETRRSQDCGSGSRCVLGSCWSQETKSTNILLSLMSTTLKDQNPVFLHDAELESIGVLERYLEESPGPPAVILDISDAALLKAPWLGKYNDARFVHIILLSSERVINHFVEEAPERLWTPNTLLLVDVNASVNATRLLAQASFSYSPFLSLLQPCNKNDAACYYILTYETFHPDNKITFHGIYNAIKPQTFRSVFPDRFKSFYGHNLQLASWADDFPYLVPGATLHKTYGIGVNMLNEISRKLNFSYEFDNEAKASWGELVNGSWIGMYVVWSTSVVLFVYWFDRLYEGTWILLAIIVSISYTSNLVAYITVPSKPHYLATLKELAQSALTYVSLPRHSEGTGTVCPHSMFKNCVYAHVCEKSPGIVYVSLCGMLLSEQQISQYIIMPVRSNFFRPTMVDYGNFVPLALRTSKHTTLHTLGQKMKLIPNYGYDVGFAQVKEGTHALLEGTEFLQYLVILYRVFSMTYLLPETIYPIHVGWIFPKKTSWKHKFDRYIQALVESGLCRYWKKVLVEDFMQGQHETTNSDYQEATRPLSLRDLQGAFIIYGLCLAVVIFVGARELLPAPQST
ncbi:uncharacterized protein [Procambarus clarkii]|uniref:uncharacterized protein n=1 Tax=Procambarus clarkii TaxID=6728 RepID=UPI0037446298